LALEELNGIPGDDDEFGATVVDGGMRARRKRRGEIFLKQEEME